MVVTADVDVSLRSVRDVARSLASLAAALDVDAVGRVDALPLWEAFDRIERLAANAKTLLAAKVEAAGAWKVAGCRSAEEHLARLSGVTVAAARRTLETSRYVSALPVIAEAMRDGRVSAVQADAIAGAAVIAPEAEERLLGRAMRTNITELREECLRTRAAADPDPEATHARVHRKRAVRTYTDAEGTWHMHANGPAACGSRVLSALEPIIDELFDAARKAEAHEPREAYAFDALVRLADRHAVAEEPAKKSRPKPRYLGLLRIDHGALVRGHVEGDELCEITGVGPVPVSTARELLGDAVLKLVITKGVDVANVVHLGRGPTAAQRVALAWMQPKCSNEACSRTFVQTHHQGGGFAVTKRTVLGELDQLCPHEHWLEHHRGFSLVEGTGRRAFVPPDDPRHPKNKPPP